MKGIAREIVNALNDTTNDYDARDEVERILKKEYLKENDWYAFYTPNHWYRKEDYPSKYDDNLKLIPPPMKNGISLDEAYQKEITNKYE